MRRRSGSAAAAAAPGASSSPWRAAPRPSPGQPRPSQLLCPGPASQLRPRTRPSPPWQSSARAPRRPPRRAPRALLLARRARRRQTASRRGGRMPSSPARSSSG
eukprot:4723356-Pyramimonas_sp.AAC.1